MEDLAKQSFNPAYLDAITDGWWDWHIESTEQYLSPGLKKILGYEDHEMENKPESWQQLIFPEDLQKAVQNLTKHIETNGEHPYKLEVRYKHKNGHTVWVICRGQLVPDQNGELKRMIGTHTDITELKNTQDKLKYLTLHDMLTHLPNRSNFHEKLNQSITTSKQNNTRIAVLFIDLDNFKQVNDSFGHHTGDLLLQAIAQRLQENLNLTDFIARLSGDEFGIILENTGTTSALEKKVRAYLTALQEPFKILSQEILATISIGVGIYPSDADNSKDLLRQANMAMYQAKKSGKNSFCFAENIKKSNKKSQVA